MTTPVVRTRARPVRNLDLPAPAPEPAKVDGEGSAEGFQQVTRRNYDKSVTTEMEKIRVPGFKGIEPARVRLGGSVTRNLGDFNSARVEVMIEMPCLPEMSEVQRVYDMLSEKLDELIPQELLKATTSA